MAWLGLASDSVRRRETISEV
ncbi:hypothetical protein [Edwardsiella tarda]